MRATLNIPDELISEVQKITGYKSKTKAIITAIEEFIKERKLSAILSLKGKIRIRDVGEELERLKLEEVEENDKRWRNS